MRQKMTGESNEEQELAEINLMGITQHKAIGMPSRKLLTGEIDWV